MMKLTRNRPPRTCMRPWFGVNHRRDPILLCIFTSREGHYSVRHLQACVTSFRLLVETEASRCGSKPCSPPHFRLRPR